MIFSSLFGGPKTDPKVEIAPPEPGAKVEIARDNSGQTTLETRPISTHLDLPRPISTEIQCPAWCMPTQAEWINDPWHLRIWEKSRQVGATKTDALDSVLKVCFGVVDLTGPAWLRSPLERIRHGELSRNHPEEQVTALPGGLGRWISCIRSSLSRDAAVRVGFSGWVAGTVYSFTLDARLRRGCGDRLAFLCCSHSLLSPAKAPRYVFRHLRCFMHVFASQCRGLPGRAQRIMKNVSRYIRTNYRAALVAAITSCLDAERRCRGASERGRSAV
jgi:hypothetical protein